MSVQLTTAQLQALGMAELSAVQRDHYLREIGKTVFDSSMVKLIHSLSEEQIHALGYALDSLDSFDAVVAYLAEAYPMFESYLKEAEHDFAEAFVTEFKKGN